MENIVRIRTWYGATAVIEIRNRSFHKAGLGKLLIPHPPLVNWLLRLGMKDESCRRLSILHEFGHLQMLPGILLYSLGMTVWVYRLEQISFWEIVLVLLGIHAFWEILAELYVRFHAGPLYSLYYREISRFPRMVFWSSMIILTGLSWLIPGR